MSQLRGLEIYSCKEGPEEILKVQNVSRKNTQRIKWDKAWTTLSCAWRNIPTRICRSNRCCHTSMQSGTGRVAGQRWHSPKSGMGVVPLATQTGEYACNTAPGHQSSCWHNLFWWVRSRESQDGTKGSNKYHTSYHVRPLEIICRCPRNAAESMIIRAVSRGGFGYISWPRNRKQKVEKWSQNSEELLRQVGAIIIPSLCRTRPAPIWSIPKGAHPILVLSNKSKPGI